jgi:hypothetical protein
MISSVLATEEQWGTVSAIVAPPAYVDELRQELESASRMDLVVVVEPGEPGRLVVSAGGVDWPFGGL